MKSYEIAKIGENRGTPRIWLQGKRPLSGGFAPGTKYNVKKDEAKKMLTLELAQDGLRVVAPKKQGETVVPVIDINSKEALDMFEGMDAVRVVIAAGKIYILPIASEVRRIDRLKVLRETIEKGEPIQVGSVSHGMGVLSHAIEKGLSSTGVKSTMAFAIDIDGDALEHAAERNPVWKENSIAIAAPLQEVVFDEYAMEKLPKVSLLEGGLPCTAASLAGRAKKHLAKPEDDPNVGHLIAAFITLIARVNPAIVVLENVTAYQETASMGIYRTQMQDLGYEIHERVLSGQEFGVLENRKRMVAVAVTRGIEFDFESLLELPDIKVPLKVGDILEDIGPADSSWSEMKYLKEKEIRDKAAGKGFMMQSVTAESTSVPTITRGYFKRRSTDPFLKHPHNPDLLRLFTPAEHARIKGIPEEFVAGMPGTTAHELLGQSILHKPFVHVGEAVGKAIMQFLSKQAECSQRFDLGKFAQHRQLQLIAA